MEQTELNDRINEQLGADKDKLDDLISDFDDKTLAAVGQYALMRIGDSKLMTEAIVEIAEEKDIAEDLIEELQD